jgi:hypothetical protein
MEKQTAMVETALAEGPASFLLRDFSSSSVAKISPAPFSLGFRSLAHDRSPQDRSAGVVMLNWNLDPFPSSPSSFWGPFRDRRRVKPNPQD